MFDSRFISTYNTHGHKLRFPPSEKAQFVTECGILSAPLTQFNPEGVKGFSKIVSKRTKSRRDGRDFIAYNTSAGLGINRLLKL